MSSKKDNTSRRKREHLELCLNDDVDFKKKTTGFEKYEFDHFAITEIDISKIKFSTSFFKKKINYPFLISCMTGGVKEAGDINSRLSIAANELNIPLGVGSQRQALENNKHLETYKVIRKNAPRIPILANLGAAQLVKIKPIDKIQSLVDMVEADAMVIHVNPLQELLQEDGDTNFGGLLSRLEKIVKILKVPIIVKEVGSGISRKAAQKILETGVKGIDVAGAGGTSWAGVELLRTNNSKDADFWDWGLPTAYCIRTLVSIKDYHEFLLIGSGGINNPFDAAKALALGADIVASARLILLTLEKNGIEGVITLVNDWFETIKRVMYLTGSANMAEFHNKNNLIMKDELF